MDTARDFNQDGIGLVFNMGEDEFDHKTQSGRDWFMMAHAAVSGGTIIHGANVTPAGETLVKASTLANRGFPAYQIDFQGRKMDVKNPTDEIDMVNYVRQPFATTTTSNETYFTADSAEWEPAGVERTKIAATFVGTMVAAGVPEVEATAIAEKVSGEKLPANLSDAIVLPWAMENRDATNSAKRSNAIYSRGTLQGGIRVNDRSLTNANFAGVGAIDWGRFVTVARVIADLNIRYCKDFRKVASQISIPFNMVRGAVTSVSRGSYRLSYADFKSIPDIKSKDYGCPLVEKVMEVHLENSIVAMSKKAMLQNYTGEKVRTQKFLELMAKLKKKKTKFTYSTGTSQIKSTVAHKFTMDSVHDSAKIGYRTKQAVVQGMINTISSSEKINYKELIVQSKVRELKVTDYAKVLPTITRPAGWVNAYRKILNELKSEKLAKKYVGRYKRNTFGNSSAIDQKVGFASSGSIRVQNLLLSVGKTLYIPDVKVEPTRISAKTIAEADTEHERLSLLVMWKKHMNDYRHEWVKRYRTWAKVIGETLPAGSAGLEMSVKYQFASLHMASISLQTIDEPSTGYVDSTNPRGVFLYKMAVNYTRKRKKKMPKIPATGFLRLIDYCKFLDSKLDPKVTFHECYIFSMKKIEMFLRDISVDVNPKAEDYKAEMDVLTLIDWADIRLEDGVEVIEDEDTKMEVPFHQSSQYLRARKLRRAEAEKKRLAEEKKKEEEAAENLKELEDLDFFADILNASFDINANISLSGAIQSWEGKGDVDQAARANGYEDFDDAFAALGEKAYFDELNAFTMAYTSAKIAEFYEEEKRRARNKDIYDSKAGIL